MSLCILCVIFCVARHPWQSSQSQFYKHAEISGVELCMLYEDDLDLLDLYKEQKKRGMGKMLIWNTTEEVK